MAVDHGVSDAPLRDPVSRWAAMREWERAARLWAGGILMLFVTLHLLNHAVGIFGVEAMSALQEWRVALWRNPIGTIALYGAAVVHVLLTLRRALARRTWRMPLLEALQIGFGLLIPVLIINHVVGTRVMADAVGIDDSYVNLLRYLWPANAIAQSILLLVVWTHGIIGLHFAFHTRRWFQRNRFGFLLLAIIIPLLALAGFVAAGREAARIDVPPEVWTEAQGAFQQRALTVGRTAIMAALAACLAILIIRLVALRWQPSVAVRYAGHGRVRSPRGLTLLEMSRLHQIPHPSSCGGRGRCSTCRVLVEAGHERLPEPAGIEKRMLDRIRAPQQVRLACQLRPTRNLVVRILLPSLARQLGNADGDISGDLGHQQALTVLFADMRGFSSLARHQPAGDLMVLLNRIIDDMSQACEARGGRVLIVETDGVMAVFGLEKPLREGARAAVQAAGDILRALDTANRDLGAALPQPVRVGIGVHSGEVVVTRLGDPGRGYKLVAIGDPVVIAHRLEEATKEFAADCIVSEETLRLAGLAAGQTRVAQVFYKNGEAPVVAGIFGSREDLERALRRRLADQDPQPA